VSDAVSKPLSERKILWVNLIFMLVTPILAVVLGYWHATTIGFTWHHLAAMAILWWITGIGITAGYHRLLSHRSFKAHPVVKYVLLFCGGGAIQNSAISWCGDHRVHHRHVDTDLDPYNAKRGFWWSHIGWLFFEGTQEQNMQGVKDLWDDPVVRFQHDHYLFTTVAFNLGMPLLFAAIWGDPIGMLIWAGLVRIVIVQHFTFTINSFAHMFGNQPWTQAETARDNWLLSLVSFGEGYHNYHHAFEADYRNGPRWYNYDPSKWIIWSLSKVGLASNLRRTPDDIVLRRRFEERQTELSESRDLLSEAIAKVEAALAELRNARRTLTTAAAEERSAAKRALREMRDRAEAAIRDFDRAARMLPA